MDLNRAVNPQNQPNSTRQEGHISHGVILHQYIFLPVMGIFGWLLQLKYTSGNASPFVTDYVTMLMFIIAFFGYFGFLTMKLVALTPNSDVREFISNMTFLLGTLATILLLLILVRVFGLFALLLWTIYLVRDVATKKSYMSVVCHVFNRVKELMINGHLEEINDHLEEINGHLEEINDVQLQAPSHAVLQIQDAVESSVL